MCAVGVVGSQSWLLAVVAIGESGEAAGSVGGVEVRLVPFMTHSIFYFLPTYIFFSFILILRTFAES